MDATIPVLPKARRRRGRPCIPGLTNGTIYAVKLPPADAERLEALYTAGELPLAQILRRLVRWGLERQDAEALGSR